ncbi:carbohydrate porin [Candidatus Binatus sp.]|uniref:carbohydrate porin n=1 Tax=Candidatus Binatus sp. TaxID=2811406 RepID=UPI003BDEFA0F
MTFSGEGRVRTSLLGLTGHQLVGAAYSNKQFKSIDQCLDFIFQNHRLATTDGSWAVYYNFDQLLYETDKHSGRGVGLFGRFGASDGDPNFLHYFFSAGVGGKGIIPDRANDQFGLGYYYLNVANPTLQGSTKSVCSYRTSGVRGLLRPRRYGDFHAGHSGDRAGSEAAARPRGNR